jgi:hypothetical protein
MKAAFEDVVERYRQYMPASGTITALARSKDLFSVQEWNQVFSSQEIHLESEHVWPVPRPILIA